MTGNKILCPLILALSASLSIAGFAAPSRPEATREAKPWVYNWWMGSAVDEPGLELQCRELAEKCFGGFRVICEAGE